MSVYLFCYIVLLFLSLISLGYGKKTIRAKRTSFLAFLAVLLVIMLRKNDVGGDLINYYDSFQNWSNLQFKEIFLQKNSDFGFILLNWSISRVTQNFYVFMRICGILTLIIIYKALKNMSVNVTYSFMLFIAFNGFSTLCSSIRSVLGVALVFLSISYLYTKRNKLSIFYMLLAVSIHSTSIIALLYWLIVFTHKKRNFILKIIITVILFGLISAFGIPLLVSLYSINDYTNYIVRGKGIALLVVSVIGLLLINNLSFKEKYSIENVDTISYNSCIMGAVVQILALGFSLLTRLTEYFWIFFIILIPLRVSNITLKNRLFYFGLVFVLSTAFFLFFLFKDYSGIVPYHFYFR